jgi:hypothetical protein
MKDKLQELIDAGPDPTRGLQNLVLFRFEAITIARSHLRRWEEIATVLDMPASRAKALRAAYARVAKKVKAGVLEAPKAAGKSATARAAATSKATPATAPPLPGQRQVTDQMSELDKIRAEFEK